jgi:hypothetical protein
MESGMDDSNLMMSALKEFGLSGALDYDVAQANLLCAVRLGEVEPRCFRTS